MKKAAFHNLGCKVNSYELDIMRQILRGEGYEEVPFHEKADVYIVNTCTVTNIADRKSRQMLHRAKKQNPEAVVIAVGCYVETDPGRVAEDAAIDLVIGNSQKSRIGSILSEWLADREGEKDRAHKQQTEPGGEALSRPVDSPSGSSYSSECPMESSSGRPGPTECSMEESIENPMEDSVEELVEDPVEDSAEDSVEEYIDNSIKDPQKSHIGDQTGNLQLTDPGHTRAYIKIQDGCNQFCSYCIIPFARGRIRSRDKSGILQEVSGLAQKGVREVVLTGIHISSYGLDRNAEGPVRFDPEKAGTALLDLLTDLNAVEGLERIRLGSLEPRIVTERFAAGLASLGKVCPHFHLSLQSGCDETLRRMNRHYTTAEYEESVRLLRKYYDSPAITTDVIVGFPGETPEEFSQTCAFLEKIRFYEIHVFRYSRRNGTVAAAMKDQIPEPVKTQRSDRLLALTAAQAEAFRARFQGLRETLLLEEICDHRGDKYWVGSTARYVTGAVAVDPSDTETGYQPGMLLEGHFSTETIRFSRGDAKIFIDDRLGDRHM